MQTTGEGKPVMVLCVDDVSRAPPHRPREADSPGGRVANGGCSRSSRGTYFGSELAYSISSMSPGRQL